MDEKAVLRIYKSALVWAIVAFLVVVASLATVSAALAIAAFLGILIIAAIGLIWAGIRLNESNLASYVERMILVRYASIWLVTVFLVGIVSWPAAVGLGVALLVLFVLLAYTHALRPKDESEQRSKSKLGF